MTPPSAAVLALFLTLAAAAALAGSGRGRPRKRLLSMSSGATCRGAKASSRIGLIRR